MSEVQVLHFDALLGTHEGITSTLLADVFSSSGSRNMQIDKLGRVATILGYTQLNTTAITTNTGVNAANIVGLFAHRTNTGGVFTRRLLAVIDDGNNEWDIFHSTNNGVAWTFLGAMGKPSVGRVPVFSQFGNTTYIANGIISPRAYNGTTLSVAGGTQSPTPTAAVSLQAGILSGSYKWKIVTRETDGDRSPGSVTSNILSLDNGQATLTWTTDSNADLAGYEIYRTTGTGSLFLFVDYQKAVSGAATESFVDNSSDDTILEHRALDEHGDAPPTAAVIAAHKGRLWWFRTDAAPTTGYYSDPGDADSVYLGLNNILFEDHDTQGDVITAAEGNFGEQLVVFTEQAVWTVSGTGILVNAFIRDWNKERKNAGTGAASAKSVLKVPAGARYLDQTGQSVTVSGRTLAYATPLGDIRLFNGISDTIISFPVKDTLSRMNYSARSKIHALHDVQRGHLIWFVPLDGANSPSHAVVWNYRFGVWYVWDNLPFLSSLATDTADQASLLLVGHASRAVGGKIYELHKGTTHDGTTIVHYWMTKPLFGVVNIQTDLKPAQSFTKRFRWADFLFETENRNTAVIVNWYPASALNDTPAYGTRTLTRSLANGDFGELYTTDGQQILTSDSDSILGFESRVQEKVKLVDTTGRFLHDTGIRLRVSLPSTNGSYALESFSLAYQILEGTKRRHQ